MTDLEQPKEKTGHQVYLTPFVNLKAGRYTQSDLEEVIHEMVRLNLDVNTSMNSAYFKYWASNEATTNLACAAVKFMEEKCKTAQDRKNPPPEIWAVYQQFGACIKEIQKLEKML